MTAVEKEMLENKINLLAEDLEVVHMYLDSKFIPREDNKGRKYSIVGRIKRLEEMEKEKQKYFFECGRNFQLTGEGTYEEVYNETFKSKQTEDTLKLVLNDIENTPEAVFNKQWESVKKKLKKPVKDSNPITKYLKSE